MLDKNIFIDTNLWIYGFLKSDDKNDLIKKDIVSEILKNHFNIFISNQVINEIINVLHRKYGIDIDTIQSYIEKILNIASISILTLQNSFDALKLTAKYKYSFFDSLIIVSTLENNCEILYSEDLNHNQLINNKIKIVNPFV